MAKNTRTSPTAAGNAPSIQLSTQKIGRLGELLVQYELLQCGIDSAPMTTDAGIDLVAYSEQLRRPTTIKVKTNLKPKPGGGKGAAAIDWWVDEDCGAAVYAFVEVLSRRIWLFTKKELAAKAQQRSSGRLHLYMCTDGRARAYAKSGDSLFSKFLFENRVSELFS